MNENIHEYYPRVSIVTVVYNAEEYIEKTILSVFEQTYPNVEYIIIDGGSTDNTINLIKKYESKISYWISEPDKGLYDAMNKGLKAATGEYVNFLNGGDLFYKKDTLEKVFEPLKAEEYDLIYGDFCIMGRDKKPIRTIKAKPLNKTSIKKGMVVNHQSIFIKRLRAPLYDLQYKYKAEWNWLIDILCGADNARVYYTDFPIVYYALGGFSQQGFQKNFKEYLLIMKRRFGIIQIIKSIFYILRVYFGTQLRKLFRVDTLRKRNG